MYIRKGQDMNILETRKAADMTQKTFGEYLKIPIRTIQSWETNERKCPDYVAKLIEFKVEKEVLSMNTMYVVKKEYGYDGDVEFYKTKEEALKVAQDDWNSMNKADKARNAITVGRCDTCHINEDGNWDYVEKDGYALCDLVEIYLELGE